VKIHNYPDRHLTYCTNIHLGESWKEVFSQLDNIVPTLKSNICPEEPFGIGLRLSAQATSELLEQDRLQSFKDWLDSERLYVFTLNGFPYGNFHGTRVKENVYAPDWRKEDRVDYTLDLVKILACLLPEGMDGGISTSPLSYKYWLEDQLDKEQAFRDSSQNLARIAYEMDRIQKEKGLNLHLDIEPEPDCLLENSRETISFFENWLFPEGKASLSDQYGVTSFEAEKMLRNHIAVCYDTCHFAVEFEDPEQAIGRLLNAGIRIGKVQISSALKIKLENKTDRKKEAHKLSSFAESTYLHQVVEKRTDGSFYQYRDLSEALDHIDDQRAKEWRIHYHVPLFVDIYDSLQSTQDDIIQSWNVFKEVEDCHHFEIETYTWEVLPDSLKKTLSDSIEREFNWVLAMMD